MVIIYTTKLGCVIQSAQQYEILMFNDKNNSWIFPNLDCTSNLDSFHLCLFIFPLSYQLCSIMTTLVRTTSWNPADLIIWKSFHHHFKRIWWGLLIKIEMQLLLLSLLKYSEMLSQMITFNHFKCHLSYFSSCELS